MVNSIKTITLELNDFFLKNMYRKWGIMGLFNRSKRNSLIKEVYKLFNQCKYQEALESSVKLIEIDSKNASAWFNKGLILEKLKKYPEAIESYDNALKIDPKYVKPLFNKGLILEKLEKYQEAIECYNKF